MTDTMALRSNSTWFATICVIFSSVCFGTVPFFAANLTEAGMSAAAVAFFRYVAGACVFLPWVVAARTQWRTLLWGMATGAAVSVGWIGYVKALEVLPIATVSVIYMTYPAFTLAASWFIFGDRPSERDIAAACLVLVAAVIAGGTGVLPPGSLQAVAIAFCAPLSFGLAVAVMVHLLVAVPARARIGSVSLGSVIGLLPLILTMPVAAVLPSDPSLWSFVIGIGLATALVPQLIYTYYAPQIGASRTAMAGSVELPTMFAIGWFAFGEIITPAQWLAGAIVISAILITRARPTPAQAEARLPRRK